VRTWVDDVLLLMMMMMMMIPKESNTVVVNSSEMRRSFVSRSNFVEFVRRSVEALQMKGPPTHNHYSTMSYRPTSNQTVIDNCFFYEKSVAAADVDNEVDLSFENHKTKNAH